MGISTEEMKALCSERSGMYGFLARIYRKEADQALLDRIKAFDFSMFEGDGEIEEGFTLLGKFIKTTNSSTLLELAREYARCFLGAGLERLGGAYPYESIYTGGKQQMMADVRDEVMFEYRREKLDRSDDYKEPEDHIAFEFEFMSYLCAMSARALDSGDTEMFREYMEKQLRFFESHPERWVGYFCKDLVVLAKSDFYKAAAIITAGFMTEESSNIRELKESQLCIS